MRVRWFAFLVGSSVALIATLLPRSSDAQALLGQIPVTNGGLGDGSGKVSAIAKAGNTVYVGGNFDYIGPATGGAALLDPVTGAPSSALPKIDGSVVAIAPDGAGGWYLGGNFHNVGGTPHNYVAHVRADLSIDGWSPSVSTSVRALAVSGSSVFIGGSGYLNAFDAASGAQLPFSPGAGAAQINALLASGSALYVGGVFGSIGGAAHQNLAALDATTGSALPGFTADVTGGVSVLLLDGSTLYVGGAITGVSGFVRNGIAAVNASTGALSAWAPVANGGASVAGIGVLGGNVYVGGTFSTMGGQPRQNLAALDSGTGSATFWDPAPNGPVSSLAASGATVTIGGSFTSAGGQSRLRIAAIDAGTALATSWNPSASAAVRVLHLSGAGILAGGSFCSAGGKARNCLAAFDANTGAVAPWNPGADGLVKTIATDGTTVYLGGDFANVGGQSRTRLAAVSAATGSLTGWNPQADASVWSIALSGSVLYVGGEFLNVGGQARSRIAALSTSTGAATSWNPAADATVTKVLPLGPSVFVGGVFNTIGGQPRTNLASLDASNGLATPWISNTNGGGVFSITTDGTVLYVTGGFTAVGGALRNRVASVDVASGVATAFNPNPSSGAPAPSDAVGTATNGYLAVSGPSSIMIQGNSRWGIAETLLPNGTLTNYNPPFFIAAYCSLLLDGSILYEIGDLAYLDPWGPSRRCIVAFDLSQPPVGVGDPYVAGLEMKLSPNPSTGNVRIRLAIPRESQVRVAVFDLQGRRVATLLDRRLPAGPHDLAWSSSTEVARRTRGIYFVRVEMDGAAIQRRVAIVGP